jgi:hypothetical protein
MASYLVNGSQSTGGNWLLGIGSAVVFAVSVTNCVVYSNGTSSQNSSSGSGSGNGNTVVDPTCSTIMLVINIILAIISFIYMLVFIWRALSMTSRYIVDKTYYPDRRMYYNSPPAQPQYVMGAQPPQVVRAN